MNEMPAVRMRLVVPAICDGLRPYLEGSFALLGHSLGALLAFEVGRHLWGEYHLRAAHIVVSGMRAPHLPARSPPMHTLPPAEFLARVKALGGTPPGVWDSPELVTMLTKLMRADLEICETYHYQADAPIGIPILALAGRDDPFASPEEVGAWTTHTSGGFHVAVFPGGHFFMNSSLVEVSSLIAARLCPDEVAAT